MFSTSTPPPHLIPAAIIPAACGTAKINSLICMLCEFRHNAFIHSCFHSVPSVLTKNETFHDKPALLCLLRHLQMKFWAGLDG